MNFDFSIRKFLRLTELQFCQIPLIQTGHIFRDRVMANGQCGEPMKLAIFGQRDFERFLMRHNHCGHLGHRRVIMGHSNFDPAAGERRP